MSRAFARPLAATVLLADAGRQPFIGCPEGFSRPNAADNQRDETAGEGRGEAGPQLFLTFV